MNGKLEIDFSSCDRYEILSHLIPSFLKISQKLNEFKQFTSSSKLRQCSFSFQNSYLDPFSWPVEHFNA